MRKKPIRLKVVANMCGNVSFITVTPKGYVGYVSKGGVPLALSNIAGDQASELSFALQDSRNEQEAVKIARKFCVFAKSVEIYQPSVKPVMPGPYSMLRK